MSVLAVQELGRSFAFATAPPMWFVLLVMLPLLVGVCWLGYARARLGTKLRLVLATLRGLALFTLCLILFRPVLVARTDHVEAPQVLLLIDDSASMRRQDANRDDAQRQTALARLVEPAPLEQATRAALVRGALVRVWLPMFKARGYAHEALAFADDVTALGPELEWKSSGASTHIGAALARALDRSFGRHVTDIVLVSDGRQTGGPSAQEAARTASSLGIPLHTVVVGDTRQEKNAWLELVEAPESVLEGDEVALTVRAMGRGLGPLERATLILEELGSPARSVAGGPSDAGAEATTLCVEERALVEQGERVTLVARPGPGDPRTRERRFSVRIPPLAGETLPDDNRIDVTVRVVPEKVRVLYVEGYPRWEYRFLKEVLKRADENIRAQCFLLSASSDFVQESTRDVPALTEVPTARAQLLENYDVVVLGDVSPWQISPDPARAQEFLESLVQFVENGGGLALLAGEYDNPRAFLSTPLEPLFPVLLDASELATQQVDTTRAYRPTLEEPAQGHEIVRLLSDPSANRRLWEEEGGLFPMYWYSGVSRAKPSSQVLLTHPLEKTRFGALPLLVTGYYPSGRTLFAGFDETWRWRFHYGDTYHERFWRNALRWLALGRIKSGDRRFKLEVARSEIEIGESQSIEARVLDTDFRPSIEPSVKIQVGAADQKPSELELSQVGSRAGVYRGTLTPKATGSVRLWIEQAGERTATAEFSVRLPSREQADPAPDAALMKELALLGGGQALELARADDLAAQFPPGQERREAIFSRLEDVWDSWTSLLFALALLATEWILRKRAELV